MHDKKIDPSGHTEPINSVACSPNGKLAISGSGDHTLRIREIESGQALQILKGHSDQVWSVAWSPDGRYVLSGSSDRTLRVWDLENGRSIHTLGGHDNRVWSVAWSPDGRFALSGSSDRTLRVWDLQSGCCLYTLEGHSDLIGSVAWSPDGRYAISGSSDRSLRIWEIAKKRCIGELKGHSGPVLSVAWSPDGQRALSGSSDQTLRIWKVETGRCIGELEGHSGPVLSVAWSPDSRWALSGSSDKTLRIWEVETRRCIDKLVGHSDLVGSVTWSPDGQWVLSGSSDKTLRVWEVKAGRRPPIFSGHSEQAQIFSDGAEEFLVFLEASNGGPGSERLSNRKATAVATLEVAAAQIQYTNAKVFLIGDRGVGKTELSKQLASGKWQDGGPNAEPWIAHLLLPATSQSVGSDRVQREVWLWDFDGPADHRLIHQLYLDEIEVVVLVYDSQREDLFKTLDQWDRALALRSRKPFTKILVAGRVDIAGRGGDRGLVEAFAKERGYAQVIETSAKTNFGCEKLRQTILQSIRWENIPWRSSPWVYQQLKDEIKHLKREGRVLMRFKELRDTLRLRFLEKDLNKSRLRFSDQELDAVIHLLAGQGEACVLESDGWALLQPEALSRYTQAVVHSLETDDAAGGCLSEERLISGDLKYPSSMERLDPDNERYLLPAIHQFLLRRGLCLREQTDKGAMLIFRRYVERKRPTSIPTPSAFVRYHFEGCLDEIYTTLAAQLSYSHAFQQDQFWKNAADFKTLTGKQLCVKLTPHGEAQGELDVCFDALIPLEEVIIFNRYIYEHLRKKGRNIERQRQYACQSCSNPIINHEIIRNRLEIWLTRGPVAPGLHDGSYSPKNPNEGPTILCVKCGNRVVLWDKLEQYFASPDALQNIQWMLQQLNTELDNESKERVLVGEVISTIALAGQICREVNVSDHGIDCELEFKDDRGRATGIRLYLQLKSGDSYLTKRKNNTEVFQIKNSRWAEYWRDQAYPVLLVVRSSKGEIRWMDVREYLKREHPKVENSVKQITFEGERFDVWSVRRWRERMIHQR